MASADHAGPAGSPRPAHLADIGSRIRNLPVSVEHRPGTVHMRLALPGEQRAIWEHLTEPARLVTWSPVVPDRPLTSVGPALSREHPDEEPVAADVLEVAAPTLLTHRWGEDTLKWRIDGTTLELTMRLSAPEHAPMYLAGWQVCLAVLASRLQGHDQPRIVGYDAMEHGWEELRAYYASR